MQFTEERQNSIPEILRKEKTAIAQALAPRLYVSEAMVCRDLTEMEIIWQAKNPIKRKKSASGA